MHVWTYIHVGRTHTHQSLKRVVVVDRKRGWLRQCLETAGSRRPRHTGVSRLQPAEKSIGGKETPLPGSSAKSLCLMRAKEGHDCPSGFTLWGSWVEAAAR